MNLNEYEPMRSGVGWSPRDPVSWVKLERGLDRRNSRRRMKRALNKARRQGGKAALREDPYEVAALEPEPVVWVEASGWVERGYYYDDEPDWYSNEWHRVDRVRDLLRSLAAEISELNDLPAGLREDFIYVTRELLFTVRPC